MNDENMHIIALSNATDLHREAVQAIVKVHATAWWHRFADLWIVQGQLSSYWRDLIQPTLMNSTAAVLVLQLPPRPQRGWAAAEVATDASDWLFEVYSGLPKPIRPPVSSPFPVLSPADDDIPF